MLEFFMGMFIGCNVCMFTANLGYIFFASDKKDEKKKIEKDMHSSKMENSQFLDSMHTGTKFIVGYDLFLKNRDFMIELSEQVKGRGCQLCLTEEHLGEITKLTDVEDTETKADACATQIILEHLRSEKKVEILKECGQGLEESMSKAAIRCAVGHDVIVITGEPTLKQSMLKMNRRNLTELNRIKIAEYNDENKEWTVCY